MVADKGGDENSNREKNSKNPYLELCQHDFSLIGQHSDVKFVRRDFGGAGLGLALGLNVDLALAVDGQRRDLGGKTRTVNIFIVLIDLESLSVKST